MMGHLDVGTSNRFRHGKTSLVPQKDGSSQFTL
jgi:hypothetical protein